MIIGMTFAQEQFRLNQLQEILVDTLAIKKSS